MREAMKDAFRELEWPVWPAYYWLDHSDEDGKPLFVEPAHRFETPGAVERAWLLNDQKGSGGKPRKTGPTLGYAYDRGAPRIIAPVSRSHSTLFLTFAQIDFSSRDAILGFAMTYGLLGLEWESHINWAMEICMMAEARRLIDRENRTPHDNKRLTSLFNYHLQDVSAQIDVGSSSAETRLSHGPKTLLAALWLQFALGVAGGYEYHECKHCKHLFEISTDMKTGHRSHRVFCTDNCKSKNYQKRKRTALKLSAKKTRLRDIAKQTETKVETVRKWIKEERERSK